MPRVPYCIGLSVFVGALFIFALTAEAARTPSGDPADQCIKAPPFKGEASTYNPYLPGYKGGSGTLATGGPYNPNSYDAALQLDLAKRYRCGYGNRAVCHAIVQAPNGRGVVVRINDNGPLNVPGRIIDLNTRSMDYLSGGTKGGTKGGTIKNVTVTLLCGISGMALGPLDSKDREAWASRTFDAPYANVGGYGRSPFANVTPISYGPADSGYPSGGANVPSSNTGYPSSGNSYTSRDMNAPIGNTAYQGGGTSYPSSAYSPGGSANQSGGTNAPIGNTVNPSSAYPSQSSNQPVSPALLQDYAQLSPEGVTRVVRAQTPPEASILVQPRQVSRGEQAIISWTSLGMSQSKICRVTVVQGGKEILVGQGNESSRQIKIGADSSTGILTFTMLCASLSGASVERTAMLVVK